MDMAGADVDGENLAADQGKSANDPSSFNIFYTISLKFLVDTRVGMFVKQSMSFKE